VIFKREVLEFFEAYGVVGDKGRVRKFEKPVRYGKWF
jgi:hypothetical protein